MNKTFNFLATNVFLIIGIFFSACSTQIHDLSVKGGEDIGEGDRAASNPIIVPIHGYTGYYGNLRPLCQKIQYEYMAHNPEEQYTTPLIPYDRGSDSVQREVSEQVVLIQNDIYNRLDSIIDTRKEIHDKPVPIHIVGISQGTAIGIELMTMLQDRFAKDVDFKLFGINSAFMGCDLVDKLGGALTKFVDTGLKGLSKKNCLSRLDRASEKGLLVPQRVKLVASCTKDPTRLMKDFNIPCAKLVSIFLNKNTDGILSLYDQTGIGTPYEKLAKIIEGDYNHIALHDNPNYINIVYNEYASWAYL